MIIPSTRYFTAGEVETGAYLNSAVTNLGNFMLGRPIAQLTTANTTSITAGTTGLAITWTSSNINRDNSWSSGTNPTRYTAATAGWYYIQGSASFASTTATNRGTWIAKNGTTVPGSYSNTGIASHQFTSNSSAFVYLNGSTDYVELFGFCLTTATALAVPPAGSPATITAQMNLLWVSL